MRTELACHNKLCSYGSDHTDNDYQLQAINDRKGDFFSGDVKCRIN